MKEYVEFLEVTNAAIVGFKSLFKDLSKVSLQRASYGIKDENAESLDWFMGLYTNVIRFLSDEFANSVFQSHQNDWSKWKSKFHEEILIFKIITANIFGNGIKLQKKESRRNARRISLSVIGRIPILISL